jgi:hypothetical protein
MVNERRSGAVTLTDAPRDRSVRPDGSSLRLTLQCRRRIVLSLLQNAQPQVHRQSHIAFRSHHLDQFKAHGCRAQCTHPANSKGRTVSIGRDEPLQKKLRVLQSTASGRARLRRRVGVEHGLAHIATRQGRPARYIGVRKNVFDLRRAAAMQKTRNYTSRQDRGMTAFSICSARYGSRLRRTKLVQRFGVRPGKA